MRDTDSVAYCYYLETAKKKLDYFSWAENRLHYSHVHLDL